MEKMDSFRRYAPDQKNSSTNKSANNMLNWSNLGHSDRNDTGFDHKLLEDKLEKSEAYKRSLINDERTAFASDPDVAAENPSASASHDNQNASSNDLKQEIHALRQSLSQGYTFRWQKYNEESDHVTSDLTSDPIRDTGRMQLQHNEPMPLHYSSQRSSKTVNGYDAQAGKSKSFKNDAILDENNVSSSYNFHRASIIAALKMEENDIIREALYVLQGINGDRIHFVQNNNGSLDRVYIHSASLTLSLPPDCVAHSRLGSGSIDMLLVCCEAGCLYNQIQCYISKQNYLHTSSQIYHGCVARAFARALAEEMTSYRNFLVQLEAQININQDGSNQNTCTSIHTLRDIFVTIQIPLNRLRTLAILTDSLSYPTSKGFGQRHDQQVPGPAILTALHRHLKDHGDTRHATVLHSLLQSATRPWFDILYNFVTEGRLLDPANEFFVTSGAGASDTRYLWEDGYYLDRTKVPHGIVDSDLVDLIFMVGKGINYIRQCLQDGEWSIKREHLIGSNADKDETIDDSLSVEDVKVKLGFCYSQPESTNILGFQNSNNELRHTLETSAFLVHSHILISLKWEHKLMQHLFALKQFLLLGQGDFFSAIMHGLYTEFEMSKAENNGNGILSIHHHTLAAIVESSLRSTNAISFSPEILERLQVDLILENDDVAKYMFGPPKTKSNDDRTIWDIFLLRYILPDPLVAVVHRSAMDCYQRMFLLLFRLKKVEFLLNLTWRQSAVLQHALHLEAQHMGISVQKSPQYASANVLLRQIAMTRQSMMHFVGNLKSYLMFEVLEGGWKWFQRALNEARTLDEVIHAHDIYLSGICRKSLLSDAMEIRKGHENVPELLGKLDKPLKLADEFCCYQASLFGEAQQAADLAADKRREAETRLDQGEWGFDESGNEEEYFFGLSDVSKLTELDLLSKDFNHHIYELLKALDSKLNGGPAWASSNDASVSTPSPFEGKRDNQENTLNDQHDLDSLRFLIFQLDNNNYYGVTQF